MKIVFLSDIHGNKIAFDLFLKEMDCIGCEQLYCLGDSIGYFPEGDSVLSSLNSIATNCLLGNHEAMYLNLIENNNNLIYKIDQGQISLKNANKLKQLIPFYSLKINNKNILLVHGTPYNPLLGYLYPDNESGIFENYNYDIIIMGHTHRPFIKSIKDKIIINTGSLGLPRDYGNYASFLIWDTHTDVFVHKGFKLPIEKIIDKYNDIHDNVKKVLRRNNL